MWMDWEENTNSASKKPENAPEQKPASHSQRLDMLLPADKGTGAVSEEAFLTYLRAIIEMTSRHGQTLTLLAIAPDDLHLLEFLGEEGARLIGRAIVRCVRQETRDYDVVGCVETTAFPLSFLVICPLVTESQIQTMSERLLSAMATPAASGKNAWLSISIGTASLSIDTSTPDTLIARALDGLRRARRAGGGCVWSHAQTVSQLKQDAE